ncbi:unnamed protein product [Knipowitschia caucasica]|uniref:folate gamma-glutamyl hydrolase n=1 Tax=Knipowitschia caucasica TaxID=637954 RepID=A0AAV2KUP8_KNICA
MEPSALNHRPIIGVVAQETDDGTESYIAASYVKFVESAGGRAAPVHINQTEEEYRALFKSINGVLYPGGDASLTTSGYAKATRLFFDLAKEANDGGDYFPVWGTCLGFQLMACVVGEKEGDVLTRTGEADEALALDFTHDATESRMFRSFPKETLKALSSEAVTANIHNYSMTTATFKELRSLNTFYRVLSTNTYNDGTEFVSTMEAYQYPFYAVQWHPEKNLFEWSRSQPLPHSPSAVKVASCCAHFFISEARKNRHRFKSEEQERRALVYRYTPKYTADCTPWVQTYYFS